MSHARQIDPVIDRIERILENGTLPHSFERWGTSLVAHLTKPVQVVVTGFPGTGKSALIEMMSACPVLGSRLKVPVVELGYGDIERATIEHLDGSIRSVNGRLKECTCPDDAVRARQELPHKNLMQNDFIEMGLRGDPDRKRALLEAVVERADVIIWCSQEFGEEEQHLWSGVPDHMKDHSLLALTMADQQLMRGVLETNISRVGPVASDEFLGLFPVATIQGITARTCAATVNEELWVSSGGKDLTELLARQIQHGRKADLDQARIFIDRLTMQFPQLAVPEADGSSGMKPAEGREARLQDNPTAHGTNARVGRDPEATALLSEAVDLLQRHAIEMLDDVDASKELDPDRILKACSEALQSVTELLDSTEMPSPSIEDIKDEVREGEEMLMLFQLERGEDAALDAATLLLQIRKELSQTISS